MKDILQMLALVICIASVILSPIIMIEIGNHNDEISEKLCIDTHNTSRYKRLAGVTYCNVGSYSDENWVVTRGVTL